MPNLTWKKSQNESLEIAYKAALALAPLALESVCPKPVATLIEHFAGSTLNLFFEQEPTTCRGKTLKIIGDALAELFETERYEDMQSFFAKTDFRMDAFSAVENSNALAAKLSTRFAQYKGESPEEMYKYYPHISSFLTDLHHSVKARIDADEDLEKYWRDIKTANTVQDMNERDKAEQNKRKEEQPAHNHNTDYRNKWNERCCLHKSEAQPLVTLETIYVMPEVQVYGKHLKVGDCVKDFLKKDTQHILLLLGHGGYGKTSFVARMAAKTGEYTDRPLHVFRLRKFADVEADKLYQHISAMAKLENNAVLVFDGLDELCMVGGGNENQRSLVLMEQLAKFWRDYPTRKIIVTSRPEYIHASTVADALKKATAVGLDEPVLRSYAYAVFSNDQRKELVDKLERADSSLKNSVGCQHVRTYSGEKDDPIYGSPFLLYLICAGKGITEKCFSNRWLLFRTVFHDININPAYRGTTPTQQEEFARNAENAKKLYRITSRLAYEIYKTGYEKQYFQKEEVRKVIEEMYGDTSDLIDKLESCYALCAYFKQTENGAVEFAHNHVRDFFLCEYILQGLDDLYAKRSEMTAEECGKLVADWLSDHFKYAGLETAHRIHDIYQMKTFYYSCILDFFENAMKLKPISCPNVLDKFKRNELRYVFDTYSHNGGLNKYDEEDAKISVQQAACFAVHNTCSLFYGILNDNTGNKRLRLFTSFRGETEIIRFMDYLLCGADLDNAILCSVNLEGKHLEGIALRYANLSYANLKDASLIGADLMDAKLMSANLCGALLIGANLKNAIYDDSTIFPDDFDPKKAGMKKVD